MGFLSYKLLILLNKFPNYQYGNTYLRPKKYSKKTKNSQEAHEAIRPIHIDDVSIENKAGVTSQENKLYQLIWERFIASQLPDAEYLSTSVKINVNDNITQVKKEKQNTPQSNDKKNDKSIQKSKLLNQSSVEKETFVGNSIS